MQVKYVGVFDEVVVPEHGATAIRRGEPFEVDDALAERLLAQRENWLVVPSTKPAKEKE